MKKLILTVMSVLSLSLPASAKTSITVQCMCTYVEDYIFQALLAEGTRENPTQQEINECVIKDGKVIDGCWAAKMNAQFNCENTVQRMTSNYEYRQGTIDDSACYGLISND